MSGSRDRVWPLRGLLLSSTALVAALLAPSGGQAQSVIINDVRVGTQNLDSLLPPGDPRTALVTSTGSVTAPAPGTAALTAGNDWLLLTNNGLLSGAGNGVFFANGATIGNTGTITQTGGGSELTNSGIYIGADGNVSNSGTIVGSSGIVIGGAGSVNNQMGGSVEGGITVGGAATVFQSGKAGYVLNDGIVTRGIFLNQGGTIVNNGNVFGTLFPGFLIVDHAAGTVTNNGNVGAVFLGAGGTVTNHGTISNSDVPNGVRIEGGNGTVSNSGLIQDDLTAVTITNSGTVTNSGTIQQSGGGSGLVNIGVHIGETGSITNSGRIGGVTGILIDGGGSVNNQMGGSVDGGLIVGGTATVFQSGKAGYVLNDGLVTNEIRLNQGGTIVNNGNVFGTLFPGFLIVDHAAGTVTNNGNVGAVFLGAGGTVTNHGTISNSDVPNGVRIEGGNGTVSNSGLIQDDLTAVTITNSGTVTNSGTIQQSGGGSGLVNIGVHIGETGSITNSGRIGGVTGILIDGGGSVNNQMGGSVDGGIIVGGTATVFQSGKAGYVLNDGLVTSEIRLNQGGTIVNNGNVFGTLFPSFLVIDHAAGTVTNAGYVGSVFLGAGGIVTNTGTISNSDSANGVAINGSGTVSNNGLIEGAFAGVTISNSGTVSNTGTIHGGTSYAGVTIDNGGSLGNSGTITGQRAVQILNGSTTITNQATGHIAGVDIGLNLTGGDIRNDGTISGSGFYAILSQGGNANIINNGRIETAGTQSAILLVDSDNTITNDGVIASNGTTAITFTGFFPTNDTLILRSNSSIQGNVEANDGTDLLLLQGTNSENLGKFLNFENLRMEGVDWTLTGAGTFSTAGEIASGTLRVNGDLTTPLLTVHDTGILAGSGTVHGNVLASTGTVRPGASGTTLSVDGGLTMAAASRFQVDIVNTSNSRVDVIGGGTATLQGGQIGVSFTPPSGTLLNGGTYTVLHADGGVGGTFGNNVVAIGSYHFGVSYDADDVFLNLTRLAFDDPSICASANQCAVGGALERLGPVIPGELGTIVGNLALLDIPTQRAALASLAGDQHATLGLLALDGSALFGQSVTRRLVDRRNRDAQTASTGDGSYNVAMLGKPDGLVASTVPSGAPEAPWGAWLRGHGASGTIDRGSDAVGANYFLGGVAAGIDRQFGPGFTAGLSFGYANTRADFTGSDSSGRINSYNVGLYGSYQWAGFHVDAVASFAYLDEKVDRQIVVGDLVRYAHANYHGQRYGLAFEGGYDFKFGSITLQPVLGVNYVHLRQNAFHEEGAGGLDLDGRRSSADSLRGAAGLRLGAQLGIGGITVAPELRGRFEHEFLDDHVRTDVAFTGQAPAGEFTVTSTRLPRDSVVVGGGIAALLTPWTSAFVDYDYKFNKDQKVHNVTAGLRFQF